MRKPVIYDGDMGGDDLWAIAMALAAPETLDISGIATVFGNVSQPRATRNAVDFLHWLGISDIPVVEGADMPIDGLRPFGDDAYGEDGVGGFALPASPHTPARPDIADWYADRLAGQERTLIIATGPATNIALLLRKYPDIAGKIDRVIFMGGAISPPGRDGQPVFLQDGTQRVGNITPFAEFNAYQDPEALNILLESGVPTVFMAADATQYMVLTPDRQARIAALDPLFGPGFVKMLMAVEPLDRLKFGVNGPFIHDPNVVTFALRPELYCSRQIPTLAICTEDPSGPRGDYRGQVILTGNGSALWCDGVSDEAALFTLMETLLARTISTARDNRARLAG